MKHKDYTPTLQTRNTAMGTNEIFRQIILICSNLTILRNNPRAHYLNCIYTILQW